MRAAADATVNDLLTHHSLAADPQPLHPPFTLSSWWTLHDAARFMLLHHVHRIWIVPPPADSSSTPGDRTQEEGAEGGDTNRPVLKEGLGVLTMTDILRAVYLSEHS